MTAPRKGNPYRLNEAGMVHEAWDDGFAAGLALVEGDGHSGRDPVAADAPEDVPVPRKGNPYPATRNIHGALQPEPRHGAWNEGAASVEAALMSDEAVAAAYRTYWGCDTRNEGTMGEALRAALSAVREGTNDA